MSWIRYSLYLSLLCSAICCRQSDDESVSAALMNYFALMNVLVLKRVMISCDEDSSTEVY